MAKRCSVCNKSFPDNLNYCPQCGAWADTPAAPKRPKSSPAGPSSGEILLDPMQPDPPSGVGASAPSNGDDIIEIDWEEIESPQTPAGSAPHKGPPPIGTPAPAQSPPIMAGWQTVPPKAPTESKGSSSAPVIPRSSSADFELPPIEPAESVHGSAADEITFGDSGADEGGSEVRLAPQSSSGDDWAEAAELAAGSAPTSRLEEPSAVNLAALAGTEAGDSGPTISANRGARPAPAQPRRGGGGAGGWLGGGLVGAGLATAACVGLYLGGFIPSPSPSASNQPNLAAEPLPAPKAVADPDLIAEVDRLKGEVARLTAESASVQDDKKKAESQVAGVQRLLAEAKYVSEQQPSLEAGLSNALKDLSSAKQAKPDDGAVKAAFDQLKKDHDMLVDAKKKSDGQFAAIQRMLADAKFVSEQQPSVEAGLTNVLKDLATAKQASSESAAAQTAVERLKKENESLADAKKKFEGQLAGVVQLLKETKYVSEQQPDAAKGLDALIKDSKKSGDAPAALAAVTNALRAANYVTADQTNAAQGVERLVADKQAAEKNLNEAMAKLKDVDTTGKDAGTKVKAAEDRAKEATEKLAAANQALQEMTMKTKTIEEASQDTRNKLRDANDTLRDIAAKLAAARVVATDARGPALVRGVDQLVATATATPKIEGNGRNGASISRPAEPTTPSDPMSAERHYVSGLTNYWAGKYGTAESDFLDAVRAAGVANPDARYYYFLGLTQLAQGKRDESRQMLKMAGSLEEQRKPSNAVVSKALERVQGGLRRVVEEYRP